MKGAAEMQNLCAAFAVARCHVFAHLPVHRRLQTIFDRERAAFDEKITLERRQTNHALECRHKFSVVLRVNIRVGDFDFRRSKKIALNTGLVEVWVIKSYWHRAEETVEINEAFARDGIVQIRAATFVEIDYNLETIEQDMLFDRFENASRCYCLLFFALHSAASR